DPRQPQLDAVAVSANDVGLDWQPAGHVLEDLDGSFHWCGVADPTGVPHAQAQIQEGIYPTSSRSHLYEWLESMNSNSFDAYDLAVRHSSAAAGYQEDVFPDVRGHILYLHAEGTGRKRYLLLVQRGELVMRIALDVTDPARVETNIFPSLVAIAVRKFTDVFG